jgi:hypothetical protein
MPLTAPRIDEDGIFILVAEPDIKDPPMTFEDRRQKLEEASRLIQTKYDAGVPLFTKDLFRDVVRQIEIDDNLHQTVSITGLDGVAVHFPLESRKEYPSRPYGDNFISVMYVYYLKCNPFI